MKLYELDNWFNNLLLIDEIEDTSCNGLQVGEYDTDITKIAFAVDAGIEVFEKAVQQQAQLLFVHHGLLWTSDPTTITGYMHDRVKYLIENKLNLYGCHIPLDMHDEVGNNVVMADILNLKKLEPFGEYKGIKIGIKGVLKKELSLEEIISILKFTPKDIKVLDFSNKPIKSIGIVSGGAAFSAIDAIDEGLDLYITGEPGHGVYHTCKEAGLNVIFGGHYYTETFGVKALMEKIKHDLKIDCVFIDVPTGL
jgi:dinuclear metal center YbgI/SA1388 family protein